MMRLSKWLVFIVLVMVALAAASGAYLTHNRNEGRHMPTTNQLTATGLQIISPVFREGATIPVQYSCRGQNVNPPLNIMNLPAGAVSLSLIMHDPDAPAGDYVHWTVWDIPASTETIAANSLPMGAVQGLNSSNKVGYMGPCPPSGTHRYMFEIYVLDSSLNLPANSTRDQLLKAMAGHIIQQHTLTGTFSAD